MQHTLVKTSHTSHRLDGKEYETKSFLKHDFMHFAYMMVIESREGFFGEQTNLMKEESIVGALQGGAASIRDEGDVDHKKVLEAIHMMLELNGYEKSTMTVQDIEAIYIQYHSFLKHWEYMKTGESFEIEV